MARVPLRVPNGGNRSFITSCASSICGLCTDSRGARRCGPPYTPNRSNVHSFRQHRRRQRGENPGYPGTFDSPNVQSTSHRFGLALLAQRTRGPLRRTRRIHAPLRLANPILPMLGIAGAMTEGENRGRAVFVHEHQNLVPMRHRARWYLSSRGRSCTDSRSHGPERHDPDRRGLGQAPCARTARDHPL